MELEAFGITYDLFLEIHWLQVDDFDLLPIDTVTSFGLVFRQLSFSVPDFHLVTCLQSFLVCSALHRYYM